MRRRILASLGGGWINPYVTDGLVAMWDGEWNTGGGVHDSSIDQVVDLSGNGRDLTTNHFAIAEKAFRLSDVGTPYDGGVINSDDLSFVECVGIVNATTGGGLIANFSEVMSDAPFGAKRSIGYRANNTINFYEGGPYISGFNLGTIFNVGFSWTSGVAYRNGVPVATIPNGMTCTVNNNRQIMFNPRNDYHVSDGLIFSIRLYSKELTPTEVSANYAIDKARFNLPDVA